MRSWSVYVRIADDAPDKEHRVWSLPELARLIVDERIDKHRAVRIVPALSDEQRRSVDDLVDRYRTRATR